MSKGRNLQAGDEALTDFNGKGMARIVIVERLSPATSQSRILFRVNPPLKGGDRNSWYDADWFEPMQEVEKASSNTELTGARSASE